MRVRTIYALRGIKPINPAGGNSFYHEHNKSDSTIDKQFPL